VGVKNFVCPGLIWVVVSTQEFFLATKPSIFKFQKSRFDDTYLLQPTFSTNVPASPASATTTDWFGTRGPHPLEDESAESVKFTAHYGTKTATAIVHARLGHFSTRHLQWALHQVLHPSRGLPTELFTVSQRESNSEMS